MDRIGRRQIGPRIATPTHAEGASLPRRHKRGRLQSKPKSRAYRPSLADNAHLSSPEENCDRLWDGSWSHSGTSRTRHSSPACDRYRSRAPASDECGSDGRIFPRILNVDSRIVAAFNLDAMNLKIVVAARNHDHAGRGSGRGFCGLDFDHALGHGFPLTRETRQADAANAAPYRTRCP